VVKKAEAGIPPDPLAAEPPSGADGEPPLTWKSVSLAWAPYALMSVLLMLTGLVRQMEGKHVVKIGPVQTNYMIAVPGLDGEVMRDPQLHEKDRGEQKPEKAEFNFAWLTSPGSAVFASALLSMLMLRTSLAQVGAIFRRTFLQMRIPIPTICFMLGLSYVTRYAGMDATLGYAFANTGAAYPFFAPILGWLGVFLTGTDAGSNALFGSLQKITATQVWGRLRSTAFRHLDLTQAQVLICTSNSTGGVMGKMIDAQSICVATSATNQLGREADIFKAVVWHSIILASIIGVLCVLQAYVWPFTAMVP
jgi:lactate permease